jgi:Chitobiase/beta-hexosaminidase C-terminal domain
MATIPPKNRSYHGTLVASTVDTVTLTRSFARVQVINRLGTNEIYYTTDGSVPTVGGDNTYVVTNQAGASDTRANFQGVKDTCVVNLISTGAMTYSVIGVDTMDIES